MAGEATPYTRGSTLKPRLRRLIHIGYPVHAGIDRRIVCDRGLHLWLPRTRGDRPFWESNELLRHLATPYTRGSTLVLSLVRSISLGYPVHAGIDPP